MDSSKLNKEKELLHSENLQIQMDYVSHLLNQSIDFMKNKFTDEVELKFLLNTIYSAHLNSVYVAMQTVADAAGDTKTLEEITKFFSYFKDLSLMTR